MLRAGLVGPRLSALIAYQKGACHMSYRVTETLLADVLHLRLSTGRRWCERIWTVLVTFAQQGRSAFGKHV